MKLRTTLLALVLIGVGTFASPAAANHTEFCLGQGTFSYSPSGTFFGFATADTTVCTGPNTTISLAGTIGGPLAGCGLATGTGTINGHDMTYVWTGTQMTFQGNTLVDGTTLTGEATIGPPGAFPTNPCPTHYLFTAWVTSVA